MPLLSGFLSSPCDYSACGRHYRDTVLIPALSRVLRITDPSGLTVEQEFAAAERWGNQQGFAVDIGRRHADQIRDSDYLIAVLDGADVDPGVAADIGYACALGIPCHGLRTDIRSAGSRGTRVSLEVEAFIVMSGGAIHAELEQLIATLGGLAAG